MNFHGNNRAIALWSALGLVAFALLPWYSLPDGILGLQGLGELMAGHDSSSALAQVLLHRRPWPGRCRCARCARRFRWCAGSD